MRQATLTVTTAMFLVIFAGSVAAQPVEDIEEADLTNLSNNQLDVAQLYNNNTEEIPGIVKSLIGDQRVNLEIDDQDYQLGMNRSGMTAAEGGSWDSPTLEIRVSKENIEEITSSEEPLNELRDQLNNEEIEYQAYGLVNRIKFSIVEWFI